MSIHAIRDGGYQPPPPPPTRNETKHTVVPAESITDIANRHGVSVQDIMKSNPAIQNPDMVYPNQELTIPARVTDDPSVSLSSDGSVGASNTTTEKTTTTSENGSVRQSSTSGTVGISANEEKGTVTLSGGGSFSESVKNAKGYGVSFSAGGNASVTEGGKTEDGVTTYQLSTDVSIFLKGGVNTPKAGLEIGRTEGIRTSYQVTMPEDADVDPKDINPFDPSSIPEGAVVTMNGSDYSTNEFKATFQKLALQTKITDESGVSTAIERTGEDTVRVTAGPTEAIQAYNGVGVDFGVANVMLGRNDSLSGATLQTAEFDLSTEEGMAAYNDFITTGSLPEDNGDGVSNVATIEKVDFSSQTQLSGKLGPLKLTLDGAQNTGNMVVTTFPDGSMERTADLQYSGNVPMNITQRWDADGNEIASERVYSYDFQVDEQNQQLLNAALTGDLAQAADGPLEPGQTVTLSFNENQMQALAGQTGSAVENGAHMDLGHLLGGMQPDGSYAAQEPWDFALSLGRNMGNSDYGLAERLFTIADGSTAGGFGDREYAAIDAGVHVQP
ncbi:LysM peptidoglycan-binding domain-containing protein [Luteimonas qiangzhengi]|uniref:LysM peptidoglycan-binding domain-containing protein n=1 Tax=Luteimonas sp. MJ146 TaxID=3129240 RepID=UPI0031BB072C